MGVSDKIKELLKTATPLKTHQELFIRHQGFLTGSVAFGVSNDDSDMDYVLLDKQFRSLKLTIHDCLRYDKDELYEFEGYRSWYVKCVDGGVLNLLVMDNEFYKAQYVYATIKILQGIVNSDQFAEGIKDKRFRCGAFQALKLQYKGE